MEFAASGLTALLLVMRIFRFLVIFDRFKALSMTLSTCFEELFFFILVFTILLVAFALGGNALFGRSVSGFRSYKVAGFTLLRMCVGDFDYVSMREALYTNMYYVAPGYFFLFMLLFVFILVNLFTVIIVGTYMHVQKEKRAEDKRILL